MSNMGPREQLVELYQRAIDDPASISRQEKNVIMRWPGPEEEDRLCVSKTGLTRAQLESKVLEHADDLTLDECQILLHPDGVWWDKDKDLPLLQQAARFDAAVERFHRRVTEGLNSMEQLQLAARQSLQSLQSPEYRAALNRAARRQDVLHRAEVELLKQRDIELDRQQWKRTPTVWIFHMIRNGLGDRWGFVCFRTDYDDEEDWKRFQNYYNSALKTIMKFWLDGDKILPSFRTIFIEDADTLRDASNEVLRARFNAMLQAGEVPPGIRTDCFLVADATTVKDKASGTLFTRDRAFDSFLEDFKPPEEESIVLIRAVDPTFQSASASKQGSEDGKSQHEDDVSDDSAEGFNGEITLVVHKVFDWLHWSLFDGRDWDFRYRETRNPRKWFLHGVNAGGIKY